jgi:predicted Zn-dependent protease
MMLWLAGVAAALAGEVGDPILDLLGDELDRAKLARAASAVAPYFLAAEIEDTSSITLRAEDGALHGVNRQTFRRVDVDVRSGTPTLDSSHALRSGDDDRVTSGRALPIGEDLGVLRRDLWREIDASLKLVEKRWPLVLADARTLVGEEASWDLAPAPVVVDVGAVAELPDVEATWVPVLRAVSATLAEGGVVRDGAVELSASATTSRFASTEGTRIRQSRVQLTLSVSLDTVADDGSVLDLSTIFVATSPAGLPSPDRLAAEVVALRDQLVALRDAPEQEPYSGPVLLSDRAAGVFFHEVFGHRMEGHRLKRVDNAQTFRSRVGTKVLPTFLSVVDDPTLKERLGIPLNGTYAYDDEGVAAQRVTLVKDGVLQGFLQSRSTVTAQDVSNGHGRRSGGKAPVTRQGNLIVESTQSLSDAALRERLRAIANERGLPYGLYIDRIQGGFTFTERGTPNAFNVDVLVAYRVFVDGRPDELVRGIDLIGTPLEAFGQIVAAGVPTSLFNGVCGAESGWVPVSAVAPPVLVRQLETQRKEKGQELPPLLPAPGKVGP